MISTYEGLNTVGRMINIILPIFLKANILRKKLPDKFCYNSLDNPKYLSQKI